MTILHTSDWHLGAMDGERSLLEDQEFFIDEICGIIVNHNVDAVIIAGDVYDRAIASAEAIRLYDRAMTRICSELKTPVITVAGNHDGAERLAGCRKLLESAGLHICGSLEQKLTKVSFPDVEICLLPWITEEKVKSIYPDKKDEITSLESAYRVVTDQFRKEFDNGKKHILAAHAFITNSETSTSDRAAVIGYAPQVPASVFEGFDYVALGHIHKPQTVSEHVRYSGTPMPYSFGKEEKQAKSVTLLDTDSMTLTIVPLRLLHRRNTITGTLENLLAYNGPDEIKSGYVRLEITDQYVGLEAFSELRKVFPNLLEVSCKTYDGENSTVTLTMEELEKLETDPIEVFRHFCKEEMGMEPDEHLTGLFTAAIKAAEEAET